MGWLLLALLGTAAMAGLVVLRLPRMLWSFAGAALMLGATGYALQGRPNLPGRAAMPTQRGTAEDPGLVELRDTLFGRYSQDHAYQVAADALSRTGDDRSAAVALLGGLNRIPRSVALWTSLGGAVAARDGQVSPAARLAFDRALRLAPEHPGPPFFLGLALVRADEYAAALPWWRRALRLSPEGASYRPMIAQRVALLEQALEEAAPRLR
jgi:predicted Zn-dependent protease